MFAITQILFVLINIAMAYHHAKLIKRHRPIHHGLWGGGYLLAAAFTSLVICWNYWLFAALLVLRVPVFNIALYLFRGLSPWYVPVRPKSVVDRVHGWIFRKESQLMYAAYCFAWAALNLFGS